MRFLTIFALLIGSLNSAAGQSGIDSLLHELPTSTGNKRVEILAALCDAMTYVDANTAREFARQAADLITDKSSTRYAQVLHQLAITHQVQSNYSQALSYAQQALQIFRDAYDSLGEANTLNNIALIYDEQGKYKEAIDYYQQAHKIYQRQHNEERLAVLALNLGVVYKGIGDYENSIENYRHARQNFQFLGNHYGIAVCNVNLGSVYLSTQQYDSALSYSLRAIDGFHDLGYVRFEAVATGNVGIAFGKLNDPEKGIRYLKNAIALHQQNNATKELSYCYLKLAELYTDDNNPKNALPYAELALKTSETAGVLQQVSDTQKLLARLYALRGDFRNAYNAHLAYTVTKDSLYQRDKIKYIQEFQVRYETERKERELIEAHMQITSHELMVQERNNQLILTGSALVLIIITSLIYYRHQRSNQQRLELKAQLAEARTHNALQEERLRISQELHDNIGSQLTFVNSFIRTLENDTRDERIQEIRKLNTAAVHELRKTVWLIHKQSATAEELITKLREYFPSGSIPSINLAASGNLQLEISSSVANHLFRIVQEGVNNAIKHAHATVIAVTLDVSDKHLSLEISDNGTGFDTGATSSGFGLRNIKKRVNNINGRVRLLADAAGTRIYVTVPLPKVP